MIDRARVTRAGLHAGGFLGPFGGGVTASMLPELGADFAVPTSTAATTITAYLVPFAALTLFSGTLGARWGLRRSVLGAYLVSFAGSALCVVATAFPLLLVGRGVQGIANAFTTPLLLATIAATTPRERLSRALGLFAALQAAGQTSGPLVGGLAAEASWRLAFVGVGITAVLLAVIGLPPDATGPPQVARLRAAWRPEVMRAAAVAFVGWGCLGGLTFLVAYRTDDGFELSSGMRGLLLTAFGVVGILTAGLVGRLIDRIGGRRGALIGALGGAVPVALMGVAPWVVAVGVLWAVAGLFAQFLQVGINTVVLTSDNDNLAGAVSVTQSFRFIGAAAAPLALTPVYGASTVAGFLLPAVLLAVAAPVALLAGRRVRVRP